MRVDRERPERGAIDREGVRANYEQRRRRGATRSRLAAQRASGALTDAEFEEQKRRLLDGS